MTSTRKASKPSQLGRLFSELALQCSVDGLEGGIPDLQVLDLPFPPCVGDQFSHGVCRRGG